ncbi:MAG: PadR family transcriptional regulator [Christensenellales bacterium]|jgi:PadR family transcriptional regulator PadR
MNLNEIPRGQLSTIILTTLLDGDKYGYEIMTEIEEKTNGEVIIKKPTLYSSLARMEKQDLVSSYWKDSDIGGKRHYYRLTDFGKKQVLQWQQQLENTSLKATQILQPKQKKTVQGQTSMQEDLIEEKTQAKQTENSLEANKATFLQQENLFNLDKSIKIEKVGQIQDKKTTETPVKNDFIQYDLFSSTSYIATPEITQHISDEPMIFNFKNMEARAMKDTQNNASLIEEDNKEENIKQLQKETPVAEEKSSLFKKSIEELMSKQDENINQKLMQAKQAFNFEAEYRKQTKNVKSYAEEIEGEKTETNSFSNQYTNQIYTSLVDEKIEKTFDTKTTSFTQSISEDDENQNSLKKVESNIFKQQDNFDTKANKLSQDEILEKMQIHIDDAVLITQTAEEAALPKVKKIAPATFNHGIVVKNNSVNNTDGEKREVYRVGPKQIAEMDNRFSLGKNENSKINENYLENNELSEANKFFADRKIKFAKYNQNLTKSQTQVKQAVNKEIKINKFNFFASLIIFGLFAILSSTTALILKLNDFISDAQIWIYAVANAAFLTLFLINAIKFIKNKDKVLEKTTLTTSPIGQKIVVILILLCFTYALHLLGGMTVFNYRAFLASLLLPCILSFCYLAYHFIVLFASRKQTK